MLPLVAHSASTRGAKGGAARELQLSSAQSAAHSRIFAPRPRPSTHGFKSAEGIAVVFVLLGLWEGGVPGREEDAGGRWCCGRLVSGGAGQGGRRPSCGAHVGEVGLGNGGRRCGGAAPLPSGDSAAKLSGCATKHQ